MYTKKMFFISALTLGLAVSTANAQEQVHQEQAHHEQAQEQTSAAEQAVEEVTESATQEAVETITEVSTDTATDAVEAMTDVSADAAADAVTEKASGPEGMWIRQKNGNQVRVEFRDDAMYCTIINRTKKSGKPKKDFEMCHGMTATEDGSAWKGKKMKHPEMPKFMTFKGTVTVDGDVLKIKGCAGMCDSEKWDRAPAEG